MLTLEFEARWAGAFPDYDEGVSQSLRPIADQMRPSVVAKPDAARDRQIGRPPAARTTACQSSRVGRSGLGWVPFDTLS